MKAYCINCGSIQPSKFRPGQDAITNESYEDLCCDTCHFIVATIQDREASQQPSQALELDLLERLSKTLTRLGYATPEGGMEHFNADLANQLYNLCRAVDSLFDREQPPAPSDAAITCMTGYSDAKEWAGATSQAQPSQADAQDAARYRWLRSTANWASSSSNERIDVRNSPELWDAAIDAAINAKGVK